MSIQAIRITLSFLNSRADPTRSRLSGGSLVLPPLLLCLALFVVVKLSEDYLEATNQLRVLVVKSASYRQMVPLHRSAQVKQPKLFDGRLNRVTLDELLDLDQEFFSFASRFAAASRSS